MNNLLFKTLIPNRWFVWTLVFLFVAGVSLISYLQWVNIDLYTTNTLFLVF